MYEITYDYCGEFEEEHNIRETFKGTWSELQEYIEQMKENGCFNIDAACIDDEDEYWADDEGGYWSEDNDRDLYSPSMPWNAPGMSVSDFI